MTVLILSTQREQMTLELAILGHQKAAKIIEPLEECAGIIPGSKIASTTTPARCPNLPTLKAVFEAL